MVYSNMEALVGNGISAVYMAADTIIQFEHPDGIRTTFCVCGECCSTSYIEHIEGLANLIGHTVREVKERDMFCADKARSDAKTEVYGVDIITEAGNCYLEHRNDSNGYYGGALFQTIMPDLPESDRVMLPPTDAMLAAER